MRIQNSEFRIQNPEVRIQNSEFRIRKEPLVPSFWILNSEFLILFLAFSILLSAEIINRIVITVGNQVITQSQIDDEIRVTAFLNRDQVDLSPAARKQAAARLVE